MENVNKTIIIIAVALILLILGCSSNVNAAPYAGISAEIVQDMEDAKESAILKEEEYYDSLEYMALCVMAEAADQGEYGMYLVASVILNRVDSPDFPNDIVSVINEVNEDGTYQFESYQNGSIMTVNPSEECFNACKKALTDRYYGILYFRTDHYHANYVEVLAYNDHFFSR